MKILFRFGHRTLAVAALLLGMAFAHAAAAVPVYTYTFTHAGYHPTSDAYLQGPGTVTGSFSGTLDASGHITRETLTAYQFQIGGFQSPGLEHFVWSRSSGLPLYFSYIPEDTGSFALVDPNWRTNTFVCIGLPAGVTCNAGGARGAAVYATAAPGSLDLSNWVVAAITDSPPVLVGSVSLVGDPIYLATTPVPASLVLFATGVSALAGLAVRRGRRPASAVAA